MSPRWLELCRCALVVALCLSSTGCIFLGAYPIVQDVTGPVRGVRVRDRESKQDIPNAQASLNADWETINQFRSEHSLHDDAKSLSEVGFLCKSDPMHEGLLTRDPAAVFRVRKRILPGIAIAVFAAPDGPCYVGPFGKKFGEAGYEAVVTAWAPGYQPAQVRYHAPLFAHFECCGSDGDHWYEYDSEGILNVYLPKTPLGDTGEPSFQTAAVP